MEEVEPILDILEENLGGIPHRMAITTDAGYFSETNLMLFEDALLNPFMATQKMKHGEVLPQVRGRIPKDMTPRDRMRRKLSTKKGQETYSKRKSTVEPVFGQMKQARGLRQFLLQRIRECIRRVADVVSHPQSTQAVPSWRPCLRGVSLLFSGNQGRPQCLWLAECKSSAERRENIRFGCSCLPFGCRQLLSRHTPSVTFLK